VKARTGEAELVHELVVPATRVVAALDAQRDVEQPREIANIFAGLVDADCRVNV
jgi:hypothetical protein